jgi:(p)ppGpp synthase/HD superfamily hydrolase
MIPAALSASYGLLTPKLLAVMEFLESKIRTELHSPKPFAIINRQKAAESVHQKLQTGRYARLTDLNDLIAFTVVLRNRSSFEEAISALRDMWHHPFHTLSDTKI